MQGCRGCRNIVGCRRRTQLSPGSSKVDGLYQKHPQKKWGSRQQQQAAAAGRMKQNQGTASFIRSIAATSLAAANQRSGWRVGTVQGCKAPQTLSSPTSQRPRWLSHCGGNTTPANRSIESSNKYYGNIFPVHLPSLLEWIDTTLQEATRQCAKPRTPRLTSLCPIYELSSKLCEDAVNVCDEKWQGQISDDSGRFLCMVI